ncbi:MAG: YlbF family regulator [Erysipelotrichaceae bacterium]|nr:YlbF family regulator [Erysipelotrichaceae bacterium]
MIYDAIDELVKALKQEPDYCDYVRASAVLERDDLARMIKAYQQAVLEKEEMERYGSYIDLTPYDDKIKDKRTQLYAMPEIIDYLRALKKVNELTDEVTEIVFSHISSELQLGRMGMLFARHSR